VPPQRPQAGREIRSRWRLWPSLVHDRKPSICTTPAPGNPDLRLKPSTLTATLTCPALHHEGLDHQERHVCLKIVKKPLQSDFIDVAGRCYALVALLVAGPAAIDFGRRTRLPPASVTALVILCNKAALATVSVWPSRNGDPGGQAFASALLASERARCCNLAKTSARSLYVEYCPKRSTSDQVPTTGKAHDRRAIDHSRDMGAADKETIEEYCALS